MDCLARPQELRGNTNLQQLLFDIHQHGHTQAEQTRGAARAVAEKRVPKPHSVGKREFLREQERDPPEGIELRVDLRMPFVLRALQICHSTTRPN